MMFSVLPVTVLIMSHNEELNISHALLSVISTFDQIVVTDSYSTDRTQDIVRSFSKVELYLNQFAGWAEQRNWMLANCRVRNSTVFFLDADEVVTPEFIQELSPKLLAEFGSIEVTLQLYFLKSKLRFAYGHPPIRRIFKRNGVSFLSEGSREYAVSQNPTLRISSPLIHRDNRGVGHWIEKHQRNADREARTYLAQAFVLSSPISSPGGARRAALPHGKKLKLFLRHSVWDRLPLTLRPFLYFVFRYIGQLGFLDGRAGFIFCVLHAFWYQFLIDVKIIERQLDD